MSLPPNKISEYKEIELVFHENQHSKFKEFNEHSTMVFERIALKYIKRFQPNNIYFSIKRTIT